MSDGLIERLDLLAKAFSAVRHSSRPTLTAHNMACEVADNLDTILSALQDAKTVRGIEETPHVIDDQHAYGDQEVYYGVLTEANFVEGEQAVVEMVACVCEESAYLSDNRGDLRDIDEFDFVVGPFRE